MTFPIAAFAIPGDIQTQTGGYVYDRRLLAGLRAQGRNILHIALGSSYPEPTAADAIDAAAKLSQLQSDCPVIIDGLALGAMDPDALAAMSAPLIALIHHPLAYEGGLDEPRREFLFQNERENLARAAHVIVPSPHTAELLRTTYGVPENLITIARPGVERRPQGGVPADPALILSVGIQIPRKGHDVLLEALAKISHLGWQSVIVGTVIDPDYSAHLERLRDSLGLGERVRIVGDVSEGELTELFGQATIFALATHFEGYGMVFAEAMATGLPIVSCLAGAVSETVAQGAGILVAPGDPESFATALESVLSNSELRGSLANSSLAAGLQLAGWDETARLVGKVIDDLGATSLAKKNTELGRLQ